MTVTVTDPAVVNQGGVTTNLSNLIGVTPGSTNPAYLLVTAYDYNQYTATSTGVTGHFSGNTHSLSLTSVPNEPTTIRAANILFTYNASTGQYTNSTYGNLANLTYTSSTNPNDVTQISVYGFGSAPASAWTTETTNTLTNYPSDYLGSLTVCTQAGFTGTIPSNATPDSIENAALSFAGKVWNSSGCWLLASTISAEAGSSLSPSTIAAPLPNVGNGAWKVAFDGNPTASDAVASQPSTDTSWLNYVKPGEIINIPNHILTVVSGTGLNAKIIDNYTDGITNLANDGKANDILIMAPHSLSDDVVANGNVWVTSNDVTVFQLDTPVITASAYTGKFASVALSQLATAADPFNTAITAYQVYDSVSGDTFTANGHTGSATSASTAVSASSLSSITFNGTGVADTIEIRAENASGYWGDWVSITVPASSDPNSPSAKDVAAFNAGTLKGPITLVDTAANVSANLDGLEAIYTSMVQGVTSITLTDAGIPTVNLSASQLSSDMGVLGKIGGYLSLDASAPATSTDITGLATSLVTTTVTFSAARSQYTIAADTNGDGGVTVTGNGVTDHLINVQQVAFSDSTVTLAKTGSMGEYTALLYQGALGRTPDAAGVNYWTQIANALPASTQAMGVYGLSDASGNYNGTLSIAGGFTNSSEFIAKYGSLTDTQFVNQLYANVLDRTPAASETAYWVDELEGIGGPIQTREHVLIGFAESNEAIGNATKGFTGQSGYHAPWLVLV